MKKYEDMKKSLLFMTLFLSFGAFAQQGAYPNFEAELRAIENHQLKDEELLMNNADAVTDVISDEIAVGQAATLREKNRPDDRDLDALKASQQKAPQEKERTRRVRSR